MIAVIVDFVVKPDHVDEFRKRMDRQAKDSLEREKGCRRFDVCTDPEDRTKIFLYELYDDREAVKVHMETPHFKDFFGTVEPWLADKSIRVWDRREPG